LSKKFGNFRGVFLYGLEIYQPANFFCLN